MCLSCPWAAHGFMPQDTRLGVLAMKEPEPSEVVDGRGSPRLLSLPHYATDVGRQPAVQVATEQGGDAAHGHGAPGVVVDDAVQAAQRPGQFHELAGGVAPEGEVTVSAIEVNHLAEHFHQPVLNGQALLVGHGERRRAGWVVIIIRHVVKLFKGCTICCLSVFVPL